MASPYIQYAKLETLATVGGLSVVSALSDLSAAFLLSSCLVMQQRWLWQSPLNKIDDSTWQDILDMIAVAEYELMTSFAIGQIIPSVADLSSYDNLLVLDGSSVLQSNYPELSAVVPASWLSGSNINLPDMSDTGLFGDGINSIGDIAGENDVTLDVSEIPSHNHTQNAHTHSYTLTTGIPTAAGVEPTFADVTTQAPSLTGATTATNNPTGGDGSHNNIQRSLIVNYWIVAK